MSFSFNQIFMKLAAYQDMRDASDEFGLHYLLLRYLLLIAEKAHIWPSGHAGSQVSDRCPLDYLLI